MAPAQSKTVQYGMYAVGVLWFAKQWYSQTQWARGNAASRIEKNKGEDGTVGSPTSPSKKKPRYTNFNKDLMYLLKIAFGSWKSKESMIGYAFVVVLLLRTWISLVVADIDGYMVKQLINRDRKHIGVGIAMWLAIAIPSSLINALIKYLQSLLSLTIRSRLTAYLRELYFTNENYFRTTHLDKRIQNPEHALTEDVNQWAERLAELLSSLGKPLVDIFFFSSVLFRNLGFMNQFIASVVVWETGKLLKAVRPNYSDIVQQRGHLEADLRLQHNRVIASSEEIAFCSGDEREKSILKQKFDAIVSFTHKLLKQQIAYHTAEDFTTKYLWNAVGLVQVAIPLMKNTKSTAGDNAKYFITIRRMMIRNGDATERLMVGIKDISEFSGFTKRVIDMLKVFEEQSKARNETLGELKFGETVEVRDLPIVTPTKDVLIDKISFNLEPGDRLLILGPNGCGKSSLFRILCGLWPQLGGSITKPEKRSDLYFIPQKPYLVQGSFRDQIIYPQTAEEMAAKGYTDADLMDILRKVLLVPVCEAHGGLGANKEWVECLSGGEKQRLGLARVFYHKPRYAILDEVSSAINVEAEQEIFGHLTEYGKEMSLITISHRHTLFKFHNKLLTFNGEGQYQFNEQLAETQLQGASQNKRELMRQLNAVLKTLGEDWPKSGNDEV